MRAQRVMRERDALEDHLTPSASIEQRARRHSPMIELGEAEKDDKTVAEAEAALKQPEGGSGAA